jgi:hypothetical protein
MTLYSVRTRSTWPISPWGCSCHGQCPPEMPCRNSAGTGSSSGFWAALSPAGDPPRLGFLGIPCDPGHPITCSRPPSAQLPHRGRCHPADRGVSLLALRGLFSHPRQPLTAQIFLELRPAGTSSSSPGFAIAVLLLLFKNRWDAWVDRLVGAKFRPDDWQFGELSSHGPRRPPAPAGRPAARDLGRR